MIDLNPLVIYRAPCKPPRFAPSDEYFSTWYTLKDKIQYIPGSDKMAGDVTYNACFHDLPLGLQTHVYAPMGLEIRNKWTLGESKAGEAVELGLDIPKQGLWLREDVDMRCNVLMTPFVKKTLKKAHKVLVEKLLQVAQLTDKELRSELASIGSYGGETLLNVGTNPKGSISVGSLPLSSNLTPTLSHSSTISSSGVSLNPQHYTPSQQYHLSELPVPSTYFHSAASDSGVPDQRPASSCNPLSYQSPHLGYGFPSQNPPKSFQAYGTNQHMYTKQYEAIHLRAQAQAHLGHTNSVDSLPNPQAAELPGGSWASSGKGVAELPT